MRIKFTNEEVEELIEFLEDICDPCTDHEVEQRRRIIKKLKRAQSHSWASRSKYKHLVFAKDEKERKARLDAFKEGLQAMSSSP